MTCNRFFYANNRKKIWLLMSRCYQQYKFEEIVPISIPELKGGFKIYIYEKFYFCDTLNPISHTPLPQGGAGQNWPSQIILVFLVILFVDFIVSLAFKYIYRKSIKVWMVFKKFYGWLSRF